MVGLQDSSLRESRDRVSIAILNSGFEFPTHRKSLRLSRFCPLGWSELRLLERTIAGLGLSARTYDRVRRVARTIADLEGASGVSGEHLAEALGYRV